MKKYLLPCLLLVCFACKQINPPKAKAQEKMTKEGLPLDRVQLPPGFKIEIFADNLKNARSIVRSPEGTIYVGTRNEGNVYAIRDEDGDFKAEQKYTLAKDLNMPNGVAVRNGQLFVAEVNRILRFDNIESHLASPPEPVVVYDKYPTSRHHGWKYIAFGPDDKLYVPVGAPCNIC
ncbi:MAG: sorbosone dehydrogenase family protein, partial [Bacteroidota bacterium]